MRSLNKCDWRRCGLRLLDVVAMLLLFCMLSDFCSNRSMATERVEKREFDTNENTYSIQFLIFSAFARVLPAFSLLGVWISSEAPFFSDFQ